MELKQLDLKQIIAGVIVIVLMSELLILMYGISQYELLFTKLNSINHKIFAMENKLSNDLNSIKLCKENEH